MPELPEVEVARRNLEKWLRRQKLTNVELSPRVFEGNAPAFAQKLVAHTVQEVERRGKWLRLQCDHELVLFSHLGMTGKWVLRKHDDPPQPYERARLDNARRSVRYVDPRLFGTLGRFTAMGGPKATPPPPTRPPSLPPGMSNGPLVQPTLSASKPLPIHNPRRRMALR